MGAELAAPAAVDVGVGDDDDLAAGVGPAGRGRRAAEAGDLAGHVAEGAVADDEVVGARGVVGEHGVAPRRGARRRHVRVR